MPDHHTPTSKPEEATSSSYTQSADGTVHKQRNLEEESFYERLVAVQLQNSQLLSIVSKLTTDAESKQQDLDNAAVATARLEQKVEQMELLLAKSTDSIELITIQLGSVRMGYYFVH